jgi:hypothetical protein
MPIQADKLSGATMLARHLADNPAVQGYLHSQAVQMMFLPTWKLPQIPF